MRAFLPILLLIATPVFACCPVDPDTLLAEAGSEALLDEIAGRIERQPAEYWQARLDSGFKEGLKGDLEHARCLEALGEFGDAIAILAKDGGPKMDELGREYFMLRARLALALWWQGGAHVLTQADRLAAAEGYSAATHEKVLYAHVIRWARAAETASETSFLPDFFDLRYCTSKDAIAENGELKRLGLLGAEEFLLGLIRTNAIWENFDTYYALSMLYMCSGRQNLAHYTRRRAWELHEGGAYSRVPGASEIKNIRPLTVFRQSLAGVLTTVKSVSDENRALIDKQYEARRAYAVQWQASRYDYCRGRLKAGANLMDAGFWAGWTPPTSDFPPLVPTQPNPTLLPESKAQQPSNSPMPGSGSGTTAAAATTSTKTWVTLAIALGILVLAIAASVRAGRKRASDGGQSP